VNNPAADQEIFVMKPDGTSPQNVTMSTANDSDPDWQPAG
jgi:Tol biopolymer transport system component